MLDGVHVGVDGFAFAVSKSDGTFAYYPDANTEGKLATDCGLTEDQLKDGYSDYITVNGERLYAASAETSDYVFAASSDGALMQERVPLTIATGGISLACLAVIFCLMVFSPRPAPPPAAGTEGAPDAGAGTDEKGRGPISPEVRARRGHGRRHRGRAHHEVRERGEPLVPPLLQLVRDDPRAEARARPALVWRRGRDRGLRCRGLPRRVLPRGLDLLVHPRRAVGAGRQHLAVTASIVFACVAMTAAEIAQRILHLVSRVVEARGVTLCRLGASVIKYVTIVGMLYWCLAMLGVDTATLLASAGLLTLAISLGAKDLVTDVIVRPLHHLRGRVPRRRHHPGGRPARHRHGDRRAHDQRSTTGRATSS